MADRNVAMPRPLLSSLLTSTETVTIHVGPKRKAFVFHKELLIKSSEFLRAAFGNDKFPEGKKGVMYMMEDDPGAVALFSEWLYSGNIESSNLKSRLSSAYEMYILATKLMSIELMDEAINTIQDISYRFNQFADPKLLARIYEGTPEGSNLRQFGIDSYNFGRLWGDAGFDKKDSPLLKINGEDWPVFSPEEMRAIWEETRDNFDLFKDILRDYRKTAEDVAINPAWTIRSRGDKNICTWEEILYHTNICTYHAHAKDVECGDKVFVSKVLDWVDDEVLESLPSPPGREPIHVELLQFLCDELPRSSTIHLLSLKRTILLLQQNNHGRQSTLEAESAHHRLPRYGDSLPIRRSQAQEVHRPQNYLMKSCGFFKAAFDGRFLEGEEGVMYMPDDFPGAVALYIHWLYKGVVQRSDTQARLNDTYELYFLATKLMIVELMDQTMDAIQDVCYKHQYLMTLDLLSEIYERTPKESFLREFGVHWYCFGNFFTRFQSELSKCRHGGYAHATEKAKPKRYVSHHACAGVNRTLYKFTRQRLEEIWQATRNSSNIEMFQDLIMESEFDFADAAPIANPTYSNSPRNPNDNDCDYHHHAKGAPCHVLKDAALAAAAAADRAENVAKESWK